jgi:hypothetical protein
VFDNPFEAAGEGASAAPFVPSSGLRQAWECGARRLLIWGLNGMGKTRCLTAWAEWAGESVAPVRAPARPDPDAAWWLLDEAQHLPDHELRAALVAAGARGQGIVLASHVRHRSALRGLDFRIVRLRGLADDAALRAVLASYLGPAGVRWELQPDAVAAWRRLAGGNVRAALRLGYELFEELGIAATVSVDEVAAAAEVLRRDAPEVLEWRRAERLHRRR